ncbi:group I truncated hemoglobin [Salinigranum sp. GCM10025319]|uniref:group I truncated hemoglobin n=1 Tax=Salinigranum sp. GCM10025319 TaxID=3252687 RepID=UPI0036132534
MTSDTDGTLYDRLGGRDGIEAVVETFYDRVLDDDRVNGHFEGMAMDDLRAHQSAFLTGVTGGPDEYDGREMRAAHAGLDLNESEFDVVEHLDRALAAHGVVESDREAVLDEVQALKPAVLGR